MLSWKPVEIDGTLFNGGASDLIGIEECTDYNLDEFNSRNKVQPRSHIIFVKSNIYRVTNINYLQSQSLLLQRKRKRRKK